MTIGWALLGPGRHAEKNVIPQMAKAAGTRLVALVSRDSLRGGALAREQGFARAYTSLDEVLRDSEINAIYDATPDGLHADNIVACAAAGKHVLVEKPLAINPAEGARAMEACARHGVKLGVVYNQRHEQAHLEARRMIRAGAIGEVMLARANITLRGAHSPTGAPSTTWRTDVKYRSGGVLMSLTDHAFDILSFIIEQDIVEAAAFSDATRDDPPNERVAGLVMKFSKGAIAHVAASGKTPFGNRPIELLGTKGTLTIANSFAYLSGASLDPLPRVELIDENGKHVWRYEPSECFRLEVEQFNRAIAGAGEPATSAREGLRAMEISHALYAAMREGRVARIAPSLSH